MAAALLVATSFSMPLVRVEAELRRLASHHPAYGQPFPSPEDKARAVEQTLEVRCSCCFISCVIGTFPLCS